MNKFASEMDFVLSEEESVNWHTNALDYAQAVSQFAFLECLMIPYLRHFGYWNQSYINHLLECIRAVLESVTIEQIEDRQHYNWYYAVNGALPLLSLFGSHDQIDDFCSRFRLDLDPGYTAPLDWEYPLVYLLLCNELRSTKQPSHQLEELIAKCRKKRPTSALNCLLAATRGTQVEFERSLIAGLTDFRKRNKSFRTSRTGELIAHDYTIINNIANRNGKSTPELPVSLACALLTRDSIDNPVS